MPADEAMAGAGGQAGAGAVGTLTGTVLEYVREDFTLAVPVTEPVRILAEGVSGAVVEANAESDGAFVLKGVAQAQVGWVSVEPIGQATDLLATLQPVDTGDPTPVELYVTHLSTIDVILGLPALPLTRDPAAAQMVLRCLDSAGAAAPDVSVTTDPLPEAVLYHATGTWSDELPGTQTDGLALLANVVAYDFPGSDVPITATTPTGATLLWLRAARDSVTFVNVSLP